VLDFGSDTPFHIRPGDAAIATEAQNAPAARPVTRRTFMVWTMAGLLTATVVAIVAPILVYIYPPQGANKELDLKVTLDKALDALQDGEAVKFEAPKDSAFTMLDGGGDNAKGDLAFAGYAVKTQGKVNVFAVNCSHLGCSIAINQDAKRFDCPCHGSQFHLNGTVLHGPAAAPLSHLGWKQGDSPNQLLVRGIQLSGQG
jgi:Rieske Fe-S protein